VSSPSTAKQVKQRGPSQQGEDATVQVAAEVNAQGSVTKKRRVTRSVKATSTLSRGDIPTSQDAATLSITGEAADSERPALQDPHPKRRKKRKSIGQHSTKRVRRGAIEPMPGALKQGEEALSALEDVQNQNVEGVIAQPLGAGNADIGTTLEEDGNNRSQDQVPNKKRVVITGLSKRRGRPRKVLETFPDAQLLEPEAKDVNSDGTPEVLEDEPKMLEDEAKVAASELKLKPNKLSSVGRPAKPRRNQIAVEEPGEDKRPDPTPVSAPQPASEPPAVLPEPFVSQVEPNLKGNERRPVGRPRNTLRKAQASSKAEEGGAHTTDDAAAKMAQGATTDATQQPGGPQPEALVKRRGRPKGSKNVRSKAAEEQAEPSKGAMQTDAEQATTDTSITETADVNSAPAKKTISEPVASLSGAAPAPKKRGRPKGSKKRPTDDVKVLPAKNVVKKVVKRSRVVVPPTTDDEISHDVDHRKQQPKSKKPDRKTAEIEERAAKEQEVCCAHEEVVDSCLSGHRPARR